jgi:hypothetical protein
LLEWCRAIIKSCRADFSSNRNSSSSPCPKIKTQNFILNSKIHFLAKNNLNKNKIEVIFS